jgi:Transglycosylase SLT domain
MNRRSINIDQEKARDRQFTGSLFALMALPILCLGSEDRAIAENAASQRLIDKPFSVIAQNQSAVRVDQLNLSRTHWSSTAAKYGLDPYVLYAVALVESAKVSDGEAHPWPWALNQQGKSSYPNTSFDALEKIRVLMRGGQRNIDIGLMQVNLRWHGNRATSLDRLIDPVTNVDIGAQILAESMATVPNDAALGIGRYHAWTDRVEAYRYGHKVLGLAQRLKTSIPKK